MRGGSWINNARRLRSAYRNDNAPGKRNNNLGFRLVLSSMNTVWKHGPWTRPALLFAMACAVAANCKAPGVPVAAVADAPWRRLAGWPTFSAGCHDPFAQPFSALFCRCLGR
ncbi:SUMF1/EgtB/PvdO family nonheme iron enzyme [Azovibrio restrictus]|uniref:SUMF1/EgtB/PvdO family nonheme iron enzyme n=1 Tax=Azovibrio restrictus TaxID=146938 RepID=UPI0034E95CBB